MAGAGFREMQLVHLVGSEVLRLSSHLYRGLTTLGFAIETPPGEQSGIVTCRINDTEKLARLLNEKHVVTTIRANEMRISPHFFNTMDDVDRFMDALAEVQQTR